MNTELFLTKLTGLLELVYESVTALLPEPRAVKRDARFARRTRLLSPLNTGWCLDGISCTTAEIATRGAIVYGKPGSMKTSAVLLTSAVKMLGKHTIVLHDPSKEMRQALLGLAQQRKVPTYILDWHDCRDGFNPLHRIRTQSEMRRLAQDIVRTALGPGKGDLFWNQAAGDFLSVAIRVVCAQAEDVRTLATVTTLVDLFSFQPATLDKLVVACGNPQLLRDYKALLSTDAKVLSSIVSTAKACVQQFKDPEVAAITSFDTIDFAALRSTPSLLIINSDLTSLAYDSFLSAVFFRQFLNDLLSALPAPGAQYVFCIWDEASSLIGIADLLATAYANLRKYKSNILCAFQSPKQLSGLVGEQSARAIQECCYCTQYLPGQDGQTSAEISKLLGDFDIVLPNGGHQVRNLLLPGEVRESDQAILFAGNMPAMTLKLTPYFKNPGLRRLLHLPYTLPASKKPFTVLPELILPA